MQRQKIIVVFCHSRARLLKKCLVSIINANGFDDWKLIVVHQKGYASVEKVLKNYRNFIHTLISVEPRFDFALGNINHNRILGTRYGFETLHADYVLGIEEDNLISIDALNFIDCIYEKYKKCRSFRGINLGSIEFSKSINKEGYSLLRFGQHGSAGVLTKKTWNQIKRKRLFEFDFNNANLAWDAKIEFYLKTGFMVTPNLSRNLDLGYGGSFAPASKTDPYFRAIQKSWFDSKTNLDIEYKQIQIKHIWRTDSVEFKRIHSIIYFMRSKVVIAKLSSFMRITKLFKKLII
jgi:hypothetical protein